MLTEEQKLVVKADFLDWSGGFPPSDHNEISVYIDYARDSRLNPDAVRQFLIEWSQREG